MDDFVEVSFVDTRCSLEGRDGHWWTYLATNKYVLGYIGGHDILGGPWLVDHVIHVVEWYEGKMEHISGRGNKLSR